MVTSISEDISGAPASHHHANTGPGVSPRPKLSYLRSLAKQQRPPPAVVITDDSDAYPVGGVNPSVFDVLFSRPFGSPSINNNVETTAAVCSSGSADPHPSPGKINGVCSSPLRHLGRSFSRDSGHCAIGSFTTEGSFEASDNPADAEVGIPALRSSRRKCCSEPHRKVVRGILLSIIVGAAWVGAAHLLKRTYHSQDFSFHALFGGNISFFDSAPTSPVAGVSVEPSSSSVGSSENVSRVPTSTYDAPFFTTWFCTLWNSLFFPVYLLTSCCCSRHDKSSSRESIQQFQEKGFTALQFFGRCGFFSILWVATNYMFVHSLRLLDTTYVVALYCSNASFVYLLSWVVLHDQFVGIRIVAVILCNTGIALLAYMDGVSRSATLGGVVLAAAAAAGSAVYKVFFKKLVGEVSFGQLSLFFSLVGLLNVLLLWPLVLTLYYSNAETIDWKRLPWTSLGGAAGLSLLANLLGNFGVIWTYEIFLTLGLVFAVPASAVIDVYVYGVDFSGMKLAGIILIAVGFFLVMFPQDWPDYLTLLLRWRRKQQHTQQQEAMSGVHRSRLRTPSGQVK